jgi:hypothetical protein
MTALQTASRWRRACRICRRPTATGGWGSPDRLLWLWLLPRTRPRPARPKPLDGITIGAKALTLTSEQVGQWEKQWGSRVETFDLAGGAGKTWTRAEQEAGASGTRQLTQEDPEPQTIYRVAVKPGEPLLVKVGLRYGTAKPAPGKIRR